MTQGGYGLPESFAGLFAEGGDLSAGKWGIAGEAGPELIRGPVHVVPTNRSMSMIDRMASQQPSGGKQVSVYNIFHVSGHVDRRTQQQIAAEMARAVSAANVRLN